jgi:hypothetical protein
MMNRTLLAIIIAANGAMGALVATDSTADDSSCITRCPCHGPAKPLPPAVPTPPPVPTLPVASELKDIDFNEPSIDLDALEKEELRGWACIKNECGRTVTISTGSKNASRNDIEDGKEINLICAPTMIISDGRSTVEYSVEAPAICLRGVFEITYEGNKLVVTKVAEKVETE